MDLCSFLWLAPDAEALSSSARRRRSQPPRWSLGRCSSASCVDRGEASWKQITSKTPSAVKKISQWALRHSSALGDNHANLSMTITDCVVQRTFTHHCLPPWRNTLFGWLSDIITSSNTFPGEEDESKLSPLWVFFPSYAYSHFPKSILTSELNEFVLSGRHSCQDYLMFSLIAQPFAFIWATVGANSQNG